MEGPAPSPFLCSPSCSAPTSTPQELPCSLPVSPEPPVYLLGMTLSHQRSCEASLLILSITMVQSIKPWDPATKPWGSAKVPRALQCPFGHRCRTHPFCKIIQNSTPKSPQDTRTLSLLLPGTKISSLECHKGTPASDADDHSPLHPTATASPPPLKSGRV